MRMPYGRMAIVILLLIFAPAASAQDDYHLYFGNIDESPYLVSAYDTVDIPVFVSGGRIGGGTITLYSFNQYISDRLGGNFYLAGQYSFSDPQYLDIAIRQTLNFATSSWNEGIFHLADFTIVMDADSADIGQAVDALSVPTVIFSDTLGYYIITPLVHISPLLIQGPSGLDNSMQTPVTFTIFDAYPNPFNSSTLIRFKLSEQGDVRLRIFDMLGREVLQQNRHNLAAGDNYFRWNGTDQSGDEVSSGIYFFRISDASCFATLRLLLIR